MRVISVLVLLLAFGATGCKTEPLPSPKVASKSKASKRTKKRQTAIQRRCRELAVSAPGKIRRYDPKAPPVELPPTLDDSSVSPAERRLAALRALDELQLRLKKAPRDPELHYNLAVVHLYSLDNLAAASKHLCRAVLDAGNVSEYRHTLRAAWMREGQSNNLELSLSPRERLLPWRSMKKVAVSLRGVEPEVQAANFENMLEAAHVFRQHRRLPRDKGLKPIANIERSLTDWADGDKSLWIAVILSKRHAKRVAHIADRARADVPAAVWPGLTKGGSPMIFARGVRSLPGIMEIVNGSLGELRIRIALASGRRLLILDGQKKPKGAFELAYWAAAPPTVQIPLPQPSEASGK